MGEKASTNRLQVLVATMKQADFSIADKMNLRCSAVIANQADREEIVRKTTKYGSLHMITTATRGVGLNRNIALMASDAEFLLFADDDIVYNDDMAGSVVNAFYKNPSADVIVFGMDIVRDGMVCEKRHLKPKRLHIWNALRYGTYTIAVKRQSVLRKNITFHQLFGGGCMYSAGEDTLFLKACFDGGLKVYSHPYVLGTCCKDTSSWFVGYNEKYFYDKGVLVRHLFPNTAYLMAVYFGARFKRETDVGIWKRIRLVYAGVKGGKSLKQYSEKK